MVAIGPAQPADIDMIIDLLLEMDRFYEDPETESRDERLAQIAAFVFDAASPPTVVVARADDGQIVGLASFSLLWPAVGTTGSLYLKELYVLRQWRGRHVGRLLMAEIEAIADRLGCSRVEFTTDTANQGAQAFYASLGYSVNTNKIFYRRTRE